MAGYPDNPLGAKVGIESAEHGRRRGILITVALLLALVITAAVAGAGLFGRAVHNASHLTAADRAAVVGAAATASVSGVDTLDAASSDAHARAAIARTWDDHLVAARRRDPIAVSAMYADDAVYVVAGGPTGHGRPAIDSMEARGLRTAEVLTATHTSLAVRTAGDVAYELGTVVGRVRPLGDTVRVVTFHFMGQWRRHPDGEWRLAYLVGQ